MILALSFYPLSRRQSESSLVLHPALTRRYLLVHSAQHSAMLPFIRQQCARENVIQEFSLAWLGFGFQANSRSSGSEVLLLPFPFDYTALLDSIAFPGTSPFRKPIYRFVQRGEERRNGDHSNGRIEHF